MSVDEPADAVLIGRSIGGDTQAYAQLVRRHQGPVRALLRRLCREDRALADDLAQDAFIQAWRRLDRFRGEAAFSTWLYRIAYNLFLTHTRHAAARARFVPASEPDLTNADPGFDSLEPDPVARGEIRRALGCLSESERAVIVQCYYLDLTHAEAAFVLGCPVGTLKSHLARALRKLRRHFGEETRAEETT